MSYQIVVWFVDAHCEVSDEEKSAMAQLKHNYEQIRWNVQAELGKLVLLCEASDKVVIPQFQ